MEDTAIIDLYFERSDRAIAESDLKYGKYCFCIADNICGNSQDAEECVSDTWLAAWNRIPPKRPGILSAFFGAITRNGAINCVRSRKREKRGGGQMDLVLEELQDCVASSEDVEKTVEMRELLRAVRKFVKNLKDSEKTIFLARYYYMAPVALIAQKLGFSESKVKTTLYRVRMKLNQYLKEEGLC